MPLLLEAALVALQIDDFRRMFDQHPEIKDRMAQHAKARRRQGIPLSAVTR